MEIAADLSENYRVAFDGRIGFGKRPALLSIDFVKAYTTPGAALFAPGVVDAVKASVALYAGARKAGIPIIYTKVIYRPDGRDGAAFATKVPLLRTMTADNPLTEIVDELPPAPTDTVIVKQFASAFFATNLAPMLTWMGVDTLILTGCSTSGCVRATAVDGCSYGYRVIVPEECVGDRHPAPHQANLFDINSKYGDVVSIAEASDYLAQCQAIKR
ncbi:isochorismatase family protein [Ferrovibrio sp.]|uniref:isochorismatase family protein n=1 Tax=Ferrovibrio sp. TaxID=1917215 RepID=UPI003D266852